jgi:hypothetical protein
LTIRGQFAFADLQIFSSAPTKPQNFQRFPLKQAGGAIACLAARKAMGKIVIMMG